MDNYAALNESATGFDGRASPAEPRPRLLAALAAVAVNATQRPKRKAGRTSPAFLVAFESMGCQQLRVKGLYRSISLSVAE
jgi:hypothetical protein